MASLRETVDHLRALFAAIRAQASFKTGYCPRLPLEEIKALVEYLGHSGDIHNAAILAREFQAVIRSLTPRDSLSHRRKRFNKAIRRILRVLRQVSHTHDS